MYTVQSPVAWVSSVHLSYPELLIFKETFERVIPERPRWDLVCACGRLRVQKTEREIVWGGT